jgi:hypothetical protein
VGSIFWPLVVAGASVAFALLAGLFQLSPRSVGAISLAALGAFSLVVAVKLVLELHAIPQVGYPVLWRQSAFHNLPLAIGLALSWFAWFKWRRSGGNTQVVLIWWLCFFLLNAPLPAIWYVAF